MIGKIVKVNDKTYIEKDDGVLVPYEKDPIRMTLHLRDEEVKAIYGLLYLAASPAFRQVWWDYRSGNYYRLILMEEFGNLLSAIATELDDMGYTKDDIFPGFSDETRSPLESFEGSVIVQMQEVGRDT